MGLAEVMVQRQAFMNTVMILQFP